MKKFSDCAVSLVVFNFLMFSTLVADMGFFRPEYLFEGVGTHAAGMPPNSEEDLAIIKRIINAYQYTASKKEDRGNSMWQTAFLQYHIPIHHVFKNGQLREATTILRNPVSSNLFWGFDFPSASQVSLFKDYPQQERISIMHTFDCLVCLAEAIGATRLYNPESCPPSSKTQVDVIIKQIEDKLGRALSFPNIFQNEPGLWTCRGIASYRAPQAIYQAWKIKQLVKDIPHPRILEIGAGLGRTAYYASQLFDIKDYTIMDLPFTALSSSYFLMRTLGENRVVLSGEDSSKASDCIKIIAPDEFLTSLESYDLILNVDSLTEMDPKIALNYWKKIQVSTSIFLSINHESNPFTVQEFIDSSDLVLSNDRTPFWMRQGYVEEIVRFYPSEIKP